MSQDLRSRVYSGLGRVFLVSLSVLLVAMPWTEYFWHFDNFLRGGQDFELGLLAVLAVLCLILVLFHHDRKDLQVALALRRWFARLFHIEFVAQVPGAHWGLISSRHAVPLPSPALSKYNLPSQV